MPEIRHIHQDIYGGHTHARTHTEDVLLAPSWPIRRDFIYTYQDTQINDIQQLGADGDVQIRRSIDGFMLVPKKFKVGNQTIGEISKEVSKQVSKQVIAESKPS